MAAVSTTARRPIEVWFESSTVDGATEHRFVLEHLPRRLSDEPRATVYFRAVDQPDLPVPPVLDSWVCGLAVIAAKADCDLRVHGAMSRLGLYGTGQLLEFRHTGLPHRFPRPITVDVDEVVDITRPAHDPGVAVAALSGGLDSTFTALRHGHRLLGDASHHIDSFVMVHGFDAALDDPARFAEMRARAEPIATRVGVPLHTVMTNVRSLKGSAAWPQSAVPLTAGALAMLSHRCAFGVVSGGHPYGVPRQGQSHPPVLDALASNGWFTVVTDGAECTRVEKLDLLREHPDVLARLKVCWKGPDPSRNCGRCEKCLVTRLNLLAAGVTDAPCFDGPLDLDALASLRWPSIVDARDVLNMAWLDLEARGVTGPEVDLLRTKLARVAPSPNVSDVAAWVRDRRIGERVRGRIAAARRRRAA